MENVDRNALAENEILLDALEFRLIQISESTKHLSEKFIIGEMDDNKADYLGNEMQEYFKETSFRSGIGNARADM